MIGIDASVTVENTWEQIARIARRTAEAMELRCEIRDEEIVLLDRWHDDICGITGPRTIEALRHLEGVRGTIHPVYVDKSVAALIDLVREGYFPAGSKVLYALLGGQPALNPYTEAFA